MVGKQAANMGQRVREYRMRHDGQESEIESAGCLPHVSVPDTGIFYIRYSALLLDDNPWYKCANTRTLPTRPFHTPSLAPLCPRAAL